jgi:predicted nucleic acid-binding protein
VLFDTDLLIWTRRGHPKAARLLDRTPVRSCSVQTYLELLPGAKDKQQQRITQAFLAECGFTILPLTERIGHRAMVYIEEYALATGLRAGDAIVAATAIEHALTLVSAHARHFKAIRDLRLKVFLPD